MHDLSDAQEQAIRETLWGCGDQALQLASRPFQVYEKGVDDYVTSVDQTLDERLLKTFQALFPADGIITEENLKSKQAYQDVPERCWLIDPIDGTEDFIQQGMDYAVMAGLLVRHQPVAGWVYAPAYHHLYWGGPGSGLFEQRLAEEPVELTPTLPPPVQGPRCPLMIGGKDQRRFGGAIAAEIPTVEFHTLGSFGLKVLAVIKGQVGLYLYLNGRVKLWDTTGPLAMAEAAGLVCCDLEGAPLRYDPGAVDLESLVHRQSILVGWPDYVEAFRPALKRAAVAVIKAEIEAGIGG